MQRFSRPIAILAFVSVLVLTGQGCASGGSSSAGLERVDLEYWRVFDGADTFDPIIDAYRLAHPNIRINYKKLRFDEYEEELIRALAEGRGPDIFSVHNTWMREYQDLLMPMPPTVTIVQQEQRGSLRKEIVNVAVEKPTMSQKTLQTDFVEAVLDDVVLSYQSDPRADAEDRIYGLPLSVDTLSLFYNRNLLDSAGIPTAPPTWTQFQADVAKLTTLNEAGDIIQSGAALGTSNNVERVTDILSLIMMQAGTEMVDERGRVAFNTIPEDVPDDVFPALSAVQFYADFANPTKEVYTWNRSSPNSFEAFANGDAAYFLGYSYHAPLIQATAPKLNYGVAKAPQIANSREVNFANFWVEGVSAQTEHPDWAWDFVMFAAEEDNVIGHLEEAGKPTALRSLIDDQIQSVSLAPFAEQLLTAETWYRGRDAEAAEEALKDLIDDIANGTFEDAEDAVKLASQKVAQTY